MNDLFFTWTRANLFTKLLYNLSNMSLICILVSFEQIILLFLYNLLSLSLTYNIKFLLIIVFEETELFGTKFALRFFNAVSTLIHIETVFYLIV